MSPHADQSERPTAGHCRWFAGTRHQVARVRSFIAKRTDGCAARDDAVLLASELATNALTHTLSGDWRTGFHVFVQHEHGEALRVTVLDAGNPRDAPFVAQTAPDVEHGRGLYLVDTLATRWGSYYNVSGRTTWFEVECDSRTIGDPTHEATLPNWAV